MRTDPTEREVAIAKGIVARLVKAASGSDKKRRGGSQKGRGTRVLKEVSRQLNNHLKENA